MRRTQFTAPCTHLAAGVAGAHALPQHLCRLLQLPPDQHLAHHQVGTHHQEAHEGDQVGQLHRGLQPFRNIPEERGACLLLLRGAGIEV